MFRLHSYIPVDIESCFDSNHSHVPCSFLTWPYSWISHNAFWAFPSLIALAGDSSIQSNLVGISLFESLPVTIEALCTHSRPAFCGSLSMRISTSTSHNRRNGYSSFESIFKFRIQIQFCFAKVVTPHIREEGRCLFGMMFLDMYVCMHVKLM